MPELLKVTAVVHLIDRAEDGTIRGELVTKPVEVFGGWGGVKEWADGLEAALSASMSEAGNG